MADGVQWDDTPAQGVEWDAPESAPAKKRQPMAQARAGTLGFAQGGTLGFADEFGGLLGGLLVKSPVRLGAAAQPSPDDTPEQRALKESLLREQDAQPSSYRLTRDNMREELAQARAEHPKTVLAGEVLGSIAAPIPGGTATKGASLLVRAGKAALQGAKVGAAYGLGSSEADVLDGNVGGAAVDTASGMGLGALGGAGGEVLATGGKALVQALRGRAARGAAEAVTAQTAKELASKEKQIRAAAGALGGDTAATFKTFERLKEMVADPQVAPELKAAAQQQLDDPRFREALAGAYEEYVKKAPEQLGKLVSGQLKLGDAKAIDVAKATEAALANPLKTQVLPRIKTYASRMLPVALGAQVGGVPGMVLGGVAAAALGNPGTAFANMMRSPSFRRGAWNALESVVTPGAVTQALARAGAERPQMASRLPIQDLIDALRGQGPRPAMAQEVEETGKAQAAALRQGRQ